MDSYFEFPIGEDDNLTELKSIDITIKTPEMYSGVFEGNYQILASTRPDMIGQTTESQIIDKQLGIAKESTVKDFAFEVYQIAKKPEIRLSSEKQLENLGFIQQEQRILVPFRRGKSVNGERNKDEEL